MYLEVFNKIDLLPPEEKEQIENNVRRAEGKVAISAVTGEGTERFLALIEERLTAQQKVMELDIPASDGATLSWVYRHGTVLEREDRDDKVHMQVKFSPENLGRLDKILKNIE
jgi:GTP-binding protein HflX